MLIRRGTSEKVKRGGGQGVLISAPIDVFAHQLFRRGVGEGTDREIGHGKPTDVSEWSRNTEVSQ